MADKYSGLLGMTEMEEAVRYMVDEAEKHGYTISEVRFAPWGYIRPEKEGSSRYSCLIGFCQLVARGLTVPDYPNTEFIPSNELIDHLNKRWGTSYFYAKRKFEMVQEMIDRWEKELKVPADEPTVVEA